MDYKKFTFENLKVYQKSLECIEFTYNTTKTFPKSEQYGLANQFIRASISIAPNIAEGSADTDKQFNRFLQIALGSINECVVCASVATVQNYISKDTEENLRIKLI